jgi:hypothetical protein
MADNENSELAFPELSFAEDAMLDPGRSVPQRKTMPLHPVLPREVVAVLLIVALCDITIYRGNGYAGLAVLLLGFPLLFALGVRRPALRFSTWLLVGMLALLAARLLWIGSLLGAASGFGLLVASAIALQGRVPHVLAAVQDAGLAVLTGALRLFDYTLTFRLGSQSIRLQGWAILLPLAVVAAFGFLFTMANPELFDLAAQLADQFALWLERCLMDFPLQVREVLFWIAVAWVVAGLFLRGLVAGTANADESAVTSDNFTPTAESSERTSSTANAPARNTLIAVVLLFAVYLSYEFYTQWFRGFPHPFNYSAYCHQGAAWLTVALAFATLTLSLIFRDHLPHAHNSQLRKLAWLWSAENLLLALAVYSRVNMYIVAGGMTRLRMVALFGVTTVAVGFVLVIWKIRRQKSFAWLVGRQLWAFVVAIFLFAITPVDAIVYGYNTRRMLADDLRPVLPMLLHPINAEGTMMLIPLADAPQQVVRDAARAILARQQRELASSRDEHRQLGWTSYQAAEILALQKLEAIHEKWEPFLDETRQLAARDRLYRHNKQRTVSTVD